MKDCAERYVSRYWEIGDDEFDDAKEQIDDVIDNTIVKLVDESVASAIREYSEFVSHAIDVANKEHTKFNFIVYDSEIGDGTNYIEIPLKEFLLQNTTFLAVGFDYKTTAAEQYLEDIKSLIPHIEECIEKQRVWIEKAKRKGYCK
ncbi:MAG: hypothetical protein DRI24_23875 [Deltaproteobacteria bacterium]|nr:MAG: hypothetical protein DRI24_23875 [Deltaproteobacteria bacterium]